MARRGHFGTRDISRRIVPPPASPTRNAGLVSPPLPSIPMGSIDEWANKLNVWASGWVNKERKNERGKREREREREKGKENRRIPFSWDHRDFFFPLVPSPSSPPSFSSPLFRLLMKARSFHQSGPMQYFMDTCRTPHRVRYSGALGPTTNRELF